jgi:hypothetical protein
MLCIALADVYQICSLFFKIKKKFLCEFQTLGGETIYVL